MLHDRDDAYNAGLDLLQRLRSDREMLELLGEVVWATREWEVTARCIEDIATGELVPDSSEPKKSNKMEAHRNVYYHRMNMFRDHLHAILVNEARKWCHEQEDKA